MPGLRQRSIELYDWFEQRLGLGKPMIEAAEHEVPENTSSWWYIFGSAATVLLVLAGDDGYSSCAWFIRHLPVMRGAASNFSTTT